MEETRQQSDAVLAPFWRAQWHLLLWDPAGGSKGSAFSNVYVPWTSHEPSMWRVANLSVLLGEQLKDEAEERFKKDREVGAFEKAIGLQTQEIAELKVDNQIKNDEILELKKELEIVKQQLEIATGMLQKEWAPGDDTPKSTTTTSAAWMAPTPKMPPTGTPSSMSSVAWLVEGVNFTFFQQLLASVSGIVGYRTDQCWLQTKPLLATILANVGYKQSHCWLQ